MFLDRVITGHQVISAILKSFDPRELNNLLVLKLSYQVVDKRIKGPNYFSKLIYLITLLK
jgi:hypothetical protein